LGHKSRFKTANARKSFAASADTMGELTTLDAPHPVAALRLVNVGYRLQIDAARNPIIYAMVLLFECRLRITFRKHRPSSPCMSEVR